MFGPCSFSQLITSSCKQETQEPRVNDLHPKSIHASFLAPNIYLCRCHVGLEKGVVHASWEVIRVACREWIGLLQRRLCLQGFDSAGDCLLPFGIAEVYSRHVVNEVVM